MTHADHKFWQERTVLITGHTGFKGAWLSLWLRHLGAHVVGLALEPNAQPSLWNTLRSSGIQSHIFDICNVSAVRQLVTQTRPHVVLHLAAQALVRKSYNDPLSTYATNVMGTANLLDACRESVNLEGILIVTSDKVYANDEAGALFSEGDSLGGRDPYSSSKACAELVVRSYRESFFKQEVRVATARAGNVIGGGDWSEDRLIPDCVRALDRGAPVVLRNPNAVRPWQHVLEPLGGYLRFIRHLIENPKLDVSALNFGPRDRSFRTVRDVVDEFSDRMGGMPGWVEDQTAHPAEARILALDSSLAESAIGWVSALTFESTLDWTADWYRAFARDGNTLPLTLMQIDAYESLMESAS